MSFSKRNSFNNSLDQQNPIRAVGEFANGIIASAAAELKNDEIKKQAQFLQLGNPGFEEPALIAQAMKTAIDARPRGKGYDPHSGCEHDRIEIAEILTRMFYTSRNGFNATAANVTLTNGATLGVNAAFAAARLYSADPSATVLLSNPGYPPYESIAALHNYKVVPYNLRSDQGYFFNYATLKQAIEAAGAENARLVIYNYPHNPTGATPGKEQAEMMADAVNRISSEHPQITFVEECLYYGTIAADFPLWTPYAFLNENARSNTVMVGSGSKIGLAGPRAGFIYATDNKLAKMCANYVSLTVAGSGYIPHSGYIAMLKALDMHQGQAVSENSPRAAISGFFQQRIKLAAKNLEEICNGLDIDPRSVIGNTPQGGMYLWVDFGPIFKGKKIPEGLAQNMGKPDAVFNTATDLQLALLWICKHGYAPVSIAPGDIFGAKGEMRSRISCVSNNIEGLFAAMESIKGLVQLTYGIDIGKLS